MTAPPKSNPRRAAAKVIGKVLFADSFSNLALSNAMDEANLSPQDKGLCTELVYGTIRWAVPLKKSIQRALDKPNQKIDNKIMPHLLVAAYQLQHLHERIPAHAAVNSGVNEVKRVKSYLGGFANLILRRLGSSLHESLKTEDMENLSQLETAFGLPTLLVKTIAELLPANEWAKACEAMNQRPRLWLRIFKENPTLLEGTKHDFVPDAVFLEKTGSPVNIAGFADGDFMVQDPASQVAALLVDAKSNTTLIDCCAAPGSKSMILKKQAGPKSKVIAIDISANKIERIKENAARLNLELEIKAIDLKDLAEDKSWLEKADAVLLDAPCSGLGTLRRHPEIKLKFNEENLANTVKLQQELLEAAAKLLKPKGVLVYSVCSPLPAEGSEQIENFLQAHAQFTRQDAKGSLPWLSANAVNERGEIQLWPHRHDCDAFFAAKLRKE